MARVWIKQSAKRRGHWRNTARRRASMKRTGQVNRARLRKRRTTAGARRTMRPGRASEEMGIQHRINVARGIKDHPAMMKGGQIKIKPRRRRKRRGRRG